MAKTTAPLFGFDGAGQIGKSIVFGKWRGVGYARRYVVPANPRSTAQVLTRDIFAALNEFWKYSPAEMVAVWTAAALGRSFTNRNKFMGDNIKLLRNDIPLTSMATLRASPGAGGGAPIQGITPTPGSEQVSLALVLPSVPTGWTLVGSRGIGFIDQAPDDAWEQAIVFESEDSTPETLVFDSLTASEDYVFSVWLEYTKPDGSSAYSISSNTTATPTA